MEIDEEVWKALEADGVKLEQMTGEFHGPAWDVQFTQEEWEGLIAGTHYIGTDLLVHKKR